MGAPKQQEIVLSDFDQQVSEDFAERFPSVGKPTMQDKADFLDMSRSTYRDARNTERVTAPVAAKIVFAMSNRLDTLIPDPRHQKIVMDIIKAEKIKREKSVVEIELVQGRRPDVPRFTGATLQDYMLSYLGHSPETDKTDARKLAEVAAHGDWSKAVVRVHGNDTVLRDKSKLKPLATIEEEISRLTAQPPISGYAPPKQRLKRLEQDTASFDAIENSVFDLFDQDVLLRSTFDPYIKVVSENFFVCFELHIYLHADLGPLPEGGTQFLKRSDWFSPKFSPLSDHEIGAEYVYPNDYHYLEEFGLEEIADELAVGNYDKTFFSRMLRRFTELHAKEGGQLVTE